MNAADTPLSTLAAASPYSTITRSLREATHLPGEIYTSEAVAKSEKEHIFLRHWLCVARAEELAKAGDYLALRIAGEPVVVSRNAAGEVVAFRNVCLHRGVEVATGSGNASLHRCPYHAWSYDPSGFLVGAPRMKESGHDMSGARLPQVRTALWRGFVFINFDPAAQSFEDFIRPVDEATPWYQADQCRVARKLTFDVKCNWKFIAENLLDWYHASVVHAGTFGKYYKFGPGELPARLLPQGASAIEFDGSARTVDANLPFPVLPWIEGRGAFSAKAAMFPNINFMSAQDSLRMWNIWPTAVNETHLVAYIMLPQASFGVPDFEAKLDKYCSYIEQVAFEDRGALESLQRGVSSTAFVPGPLAHLEAQLQHLLKHYVDVMDLEHARPAHAA